MQWGTQCPNTEVAAVRMCDFWHLFVHYVLAGALRLWKFSGISLCICVGAGIYSGIYLCIMCKCWQWHHFVWRVWKELAFSRFAEQ